MLMGVARPQIARRRWCSTTSGRSIEARGLARIKTYVGRTPAPDDWDDAVRILRRLHGAQFTALSDDDWDAFARMTYRDEDGRPVADYDPALGRDLRRRRVRPADAGAVGRVPARSRQSRSWPSAARTPISCRPRPSPRWPPTHPRVESIIVRRRRPRRRSSATPRSSSASRPSSPASKAPGRRPTRSFRAPYAPYDLDARRRDRPSRRKSPPDRDAASSLAALFALPAVGALDVAGRCRRSPESSPGRPSRRARCARGRPGSAPIQRASRRRPGGDLAEVEDAEAVEQLPRCAWPMPRMRWRLSGTPLRGPRQSRRPHRRSGRRRPRRGDVRVRLDLLLDDLLDLDGRRPRASPNSSSRLGLQVVGVPVLDDIPPRAVCRWSARGLAGAGLTWIGVSGSPRLVVDDRRRSATARRPLAGARRNSGRQTGPTPKRVLMPSTTSPTASATAPCASASELRARTR